MLEQFGGEHAVGDDPLVVVQVVDEQVDRPEALLQPAPRRARHSRRGDHPRDDVERPGAVDATTVGVHGERDPHREDVELGQGLAFLQLAVLERGELVEQRPRRLAGRPVGGQELVPGVVVGAHVCHRHRPTFVNPDVRTIPTL